MEALAAGHAPYACKSDVPAPLRADAENEHPAFGQPRYHFNEQADTLRLVVHIPGVDPAGIDLEVNAPDLTITAARMHSEPHRRRQTPPAEPARDYQLRLRLGFNLAYEALRAELHGSMLTVTIPKQAAAAVPIDIVR